MATQTTVGGLTIPGNVGLTNVFIEAAGYFSDMINQRLIKRSIWANLVERGDWPDGEGDTLSAITYDRTLPNGPQLWSPVNANAGSTNFAIPEATRVGVAQTIKQYGLFHTAIESLPITVNDVRFSWRTQQQMAAIYENLTSNVQRIWEIRFRDEYRRLCGTKYVVGLANNGALYSTTAADYPNDITATTLTTGAVTGGIGILTQAFLERIRTPLIFDGAGEEAMGYQNGRPLFTVIAGSDALDSLIRIDPSIREDYRNSAQVDELLKPWGVERSFRGFLHIADDMAPRYNYVESGAVNPFSAATSITVTNWDAATGTGTITLVGASTATVLAAGVNFDCGPQLVRGKVLAVQSTTVFTFQAQAASNVALTVANFRIKNRDWSENISQGFHEVPFYVPGSADSQNVSLDTATNTHGRSSGVRWVPNPAYAIAPFEEGFILHKKVYKCVIPNPFTSAGSGANFKAVSYTGKYDFLNIQDRLYNPDMSWGNFRAVMASGSLPLKTQWGVAFIYRRFDMPGAVLAPPTWGAATAAGQVNYPSVELATDAQD